MRRSVSIVAMLAMLLSVFVPAGAFADSANAGDPPEPVASDDELQIAEVIEEPPPRPELELTKGWTGLDDLDTPNLEVIFLVDEDVVAVGDTVTVPPGQELTLDEQVTGLPDGCSFLGDLPASFTVPEDVEDGELITIAVTNDATCEPEEPEVPEEAPVEPEEPEAVGDEEPEALDAVEGRPTEVRLPRTGAPHALLALLALLLAAAGAALLQRRGSNE